MKKFILLSVLMITTAASFSQISIYVRLTDYAGKVLSTNGTMDAPLPLRENMISTDNGQFFLVTSFTGTAVQTLNIGSQSTGAGAGKVTFNPFTITRKMDAASPLLFQNSASGTPFKTAEVFFMNGQNVVVKQTFKLAAVKSITWSACTDKDKDCNTVNETLLFEYGGQLITVGKSQGGWNRVRNIQDNDPNTVVQ